MKTLNKVIKKYRNLCHNENNYSVGGGLSCTGKKASNRHEDALDDKGKLTLGKASQMFRKATGKELHEVKEVLNFAIPNMEWHHAGFMPKEYGGGMKKTYFLNAREIVEVAQNWDSYCEKLEISKKIELDDLSKKRSLEDLKLKFLKKYSEKITRTLTIPRFFFETNREMDGKYGWFCSYGKSYRMDEYLTGWAFKSDKKLKQFLSL